MYKASTGFLSTDTGLYREETGYGSVELPGVCVFVFVYLCVFVCVWIRCTCHTVAVPLSGGQDTDTQATDRRCQLP